MSVRSFFVSFLLVYPLLTVGHGHAEVVGDVDFSTYSDGDLVGQNGWERFGNVDTNPLQVQDGAVSWPGGRTISNEDAIKLLDRLVSAPSESDPTKVVQFDLTLKVISAPELAGSITSPSYFAGLSTLASTVAGGANFPNIRLTAIARDEGFVFGARVTGQGGSPYSYGETVLSFDTEYALRAVIYMNPGLRNDTIDLYVGNDFDNLVFQVSASYLETGAATDPLSFGGIILSQFGTPSVGEPGVSITSISVTVVEPGVGASVVGSFVFHGGWIGGGSAVDTGKVLAKQGTGLGELTYDNLINTARGLNGLVFDIQDLANAAGLSAADFQFQVSPQGAFSQAANPPADWVSAPAPTSLAVTPGSPARVQITWPDNAISNRWLRVTILANANTGLAAPETYYIGHLLGETTGVSSGFYTVSFSDITPIRSVVGQTVDASSPVDIDKNGTVAFADVSAMRPNVGAQLTNISIP
jgi:hypothetical protein